MIPMRSFKKRRENLKFTETSKYTRGGGFYGIRDAIFEIPIDTSPGEIGKAIDKALALCIGKGEEDFERAVGRNPAANSREKWPESHFLTCKENFSPVFSPLGRV